MSKRDEILAAAQALFAEYGYAGTTMRMISERAGVAFGLVSHYFGSKENLFLAAGHEMIDAMLALIRRDMEVAENGLHPRQGRHFRRGPLSIAAGDPKGRFGILPGQAADSLTGLLIGPGGDGAGVHDHQVRVGPRERGAPP